MSTILTVMHGPPREFDVLRWDTGRLPSVVSAGLFVCPGSGTHRERVIDDFELIYVRTGTLGMVEADRELIVRRHGALLLWPGRTHRGLVAYERDLSFYWVHFVMPHRDERHGVVAADDPPVVGVPQLSTARSPERMVASFDRLLHSRSDERSGELEAALQLALVLVDLSRSAEADEEGGMSPHRRAVVRRVDEYIAAHLHEPLSTRHIAADLGYNPDYLGRLYHAATGHTLVAGIHRRRVAEARLLLTQTTRTVDEIAYECGYADPGYFRRVFRRTTGSTPSAFRDTYYRAKINTR